MQYTATKFITEIAFELLPSCINNFIILPGMNQLCLLNRNEISYGQLNFN